MIHVVSPYETSNFMILIPKAQFFSFLVVVVGEIDGVICKAITGGSFFLSLHHFIHILLHAYLL